MEDPHGLYLPKEFLLVLFNLSKELEGQQKMSALHATSRKTCSPCNSILGRLALFQK